MIAEITIVGNVGSEPQKHTVKRENKLSFNVTRFPVIVNQSYKVGEVWHENNVLYSISAFKGLGNKALELNVGDTVYVHGTFTVNNKQGTYYLDVNAQTIRVIRRNSI